MGDLLNTLAVAGRSLQVQQQGVEVTGQNLANVNNPAYARQRLVVQTSPDVPTSAGPEGTGAEVVAIQQLRDSLLDRQIQTEQSTTGLLEAQQRSLQYAETILGEQIGGGASSADGAAGVGDVTSAGGLANAINNLFNAFQSLSTSPGSLVERGQVISAAQQLSTQFNQAEARLAGLRSTLNDSLNADLDKANQLLSTIANLNRQITRTEANSGGAANDLRDLRQQNIENLAKLADIQTAAETDGSVNVSLNGHLLVTGSQVLDSLQSYDAGNGQLLVRTSDSNLPLTLAGGSLQGTIAARDGAVADLQHGLDDLAANLSSEINKVHQTGFNLDGGSGAKFFDGTTAGDLRLNPALADNPALIQASGVAGATGDNQVALALAQLADQRQAALGQQTFSGAYAQTVANLGQSLAATNSQLTDQQAISNLLQRQRDSVSGVSLDEEMTNLLTYQKAYQASARLINTVSAMLDEVLNLTR